MRLFKRLKVCVLLLNKKLDAQYLKGLKAFLIENKGRKKARRGLGSEPGRAVVGNPMQLGRLIWVGCWRLV